MIVVEISLQRIYKVPVYAEGTPASGGADHFLAFIERELLPLAEKEYRVDTSDRGFIGASYGGLFAAWAMVNRPTLVQRYIMTSPALYWDDYLFVKQKETLEKNPNAQREGIYVSAGEKELNHSCRASYDSVNGLPHTTTQDSSSRSISCVKEIMKPAT